MRLSFIPGGLLLVKEGSRYIITIEGTDVFNTKREKAALKKFQAIRKDMEKKYPAQELTAEQKQEALKRLIGDSILRAVRNEQRNSKFGRPKQGRFDNR